MIKLFQPDSNGEYKWWQLAIFFVIFFCIVFVLGSILSDYV